MPAAKRTSIADAFAERFSDVWILLSGTTVYLSRTALFGQYEPQLRAWRAALQSAAHDTEAVRGIRQEIVALRKELRTRGHDLSLGAQNLRFEGFRNDACIREGFRRVVLFFGDERVYWFVGDDNHVALADFLESRLEASGVRVVTERHYLWFKRRGTDLVLSGSDTESKDDFARLERIGNANPFLLLAGLKGLK